MCPAYCHPLNLLSFFQKNTLFLLRLKGDFMEEVSDLILAMRQEAFQEL
jgi:hypothetical protein